MSEMIDRDETLNALHTQLAYPTEACAIVRSIAPNERLREALDLIEKISMRDGMTLGGRVATIQKLAAQALSPLPQGNT
jgi:hypothetical protein